MREEKQQSIEDELESINNQAQDYFNKCIKALSNVDNTRRTFHQHSTDFYWAKLEEGLKDESEELQDKIITLGRRAAIICRNSALVTEADQRELVLSIKRLRAAVWLRKFYYSDADVLHDEGVVLGVQQAHQSENSSENPSAAKTEFENTYNSLLRVFALADAEYIGGEHLRRSALELHQANKNRQNTAFIMMWIGSSKPELDDINDAVKQVFSSFGIKALRSDDIEHQDVITKRIIDEITTSEFLFADLTGSRPSVYYEVGYTHALNKEVILYRKKGTDLHFDLAGYNCPEYENLLDLRRRLTKRLKDIISKKAKDT